MPRKSFLRPKRTLVSQWLQISVIASLVGILLLILESGSGFGVISSTSMLNSKAQPKFINSLPSPEKIDATKGGNFTVEMRETEQWLGLYSGPGADGEYGTSDDEILNTTIWGYGLEGQNVTYPGPTFIAQKDVPIEVDWENELPQDGHLLPVDTEMHQYDEHDEHHGLVQKALEQGLVPTVVHLHGGHTETTSDGIPDAWFTQNYSLTGPDWVKKTYTYDNDQEAATLWYHDHTHRLTSLSVYAGLTGYYLLRDDNENNLINNNVLPSGDYEREILIQDKQFTTDGQLFYPEDTNTNPPGVPNRTGAYGDVILVNGIAWPKLEVEPRKYRLRLLNGSDSRFYKLDLQDSYEKLYLVGTEHGLLENPVALDYLVLAPAERADVIVDFTNDAGKEFILRNYGPGADPGTTGQIMKFTVNQPLSDVPNATVDTDQSDGLTTQLRPDKITLPEQTGPTRQLALFQIREANNNELFLLGTLKDGSLTYHDPVTETPLVGTTEVWEIYNPTQYAHSVHLHLVAFQVLNRQKFSGNLVTEAEPMEGETKQFLRNVTLLDNPKDPEPYEKGKKDTVIVNPNEVVRIIATFDRPGEYVWHCHILTHEDHDMMRPIQVVTSPEDQVPDELLAGGLVGEHSDGDSLHARSSSLAPDVTADSMTLGTQTDFLGNTNTILEPFQQPIFGASTNLINTSFSNTGMTEGSAFM